MKKIIINEGENKTLTICSSQDVFLELNPSATLLLKLFVTDHNFLMKFRADLKENAHLAVIFADFSSGKVEINGLTKLVGNGAKVEWKLASLSKDVDRKNIDVSFIHEAPNTYATMENYGIAKDESKLIFTGVNHVMNGMSKSFSSQQAKIIVFDKNSHGEASPILKIDENDIVAKHSAIVGQLNDDHIYYLMTRGLTIDDAKKLITLGYLMPICNYFDDNNKTQMEKIVMERM